MGMYFGGMYRLTCVSNPHLKIADHGIENRRLGSKYYFMGIPALGIMNDDKVGEFPRLKGAENVNTTLKCVLLYAKNP